MELSDHETSIGQLVAQRADRSRLFERFGIDFYCAGNQSLDEACRAAGIDTNEALAQLAAHDASEEPGANAADLTMAELADHIEQTHHAYLRQMLPKLTSMLAEVDAVAHAWAGPMSQVFGALRSELEVHMMKEEQILFPMVRQLEVAGSPPSFHCGSIGNPIAAMEHEHEVVADALRRLRQLSEGFAVAAGTATANGVMSGLAELEEDLHQHIHKENNILFVRAAEVEQRLAAEA